MPSTNQETTRPKITILATGGTIAGVGDQGKSLGYSSGSLKVSDLLQSVPGLDEVAEIEEHQVCNVNSDDITSEIWIQLARKVDEIAGRKDIDGIVITHGTDTMEETAFFLDLALNTEKPVVITGSMRPATAVSADGPMNILEAVAVASCPESAGRGVLVQLAGQIISAQHVRKSNTHALAAMSGGEAGSCGQVCDGKVSYFWLAGRNSIETDFNLERATSLPQVSVLFFNVDANPALIEAAAQFSEGIVIAGAGAGEYSLQFKDAIDRLSIPVVVASRIGLGSVEQETMLSPNAIAAGSLPPQKAAILLRFLLAKSADKTEIAEAFSRY